MLSVSKSMTTLWLNALIPQLMRETDYEDIDTTSLQLISQTYGPVNSEGEDDYLNL